MDTVKPELAVSARRRRLPSASKVSAYICVFLENNYFFQSIVVVCCATKVNNSSGDVHSFKASCRLHASTVKMSRYVHLRMPARIDEPVYMIVLTPLVSLCMRSYAHTQTRIHLTSPPLTVRHFVFSYSATEIFLRNDPLRTGKVSVCVCRFISLCLNTPIKMIHPLKSFVKLVF